MAWPLSPQNRRATHIPFSVDHDEHGNERGTMRVSCVDPRTDPGWLRLIQAGVSDVFHSPAWLSVLADTYHWQPRALVLVDPDERPVAGLPFVHVADMV